MPCRDLPGCFLWPGLDFSKPGKAEANWCVGWRDVDNAVVFLAESQQLGSIKAIDSGLQVCKLRDEKCDGVDPELDGEGASTTLQTTPSPRHKRSIAAGPGEVEGSCSHAVVAGGLPALRVTDAALPRSSLPRAHWLLDDKMHGPLPPKRPPPCPGRADSFPLPAARATDQQEILKMSQAAQWDRATRRNPPISLSSETPAGSRSQPGEP